MGVQPGSDGGGTVSSPVEVTRWMGRSGVGVRLSDVSGCSHEMSDPTLLLNVQGVHKVNRKGCADHTDHLKSYGKEV